jgi:hypothetical protein
MGQPLVGKLGASPLFRRSDHVIAGVGKRIGVEAAVVVPLRPHTGDPVTSVVGQAEDMSIPARRCRVDGMGAMQFSSSPPAAHAQEIVHTDRPRVLENDKAQVRHLALECLDQLGWGRRLARQIHTLDFCAYRSQSRDTQAEAFDYGKILRVNG